MRERRLPVYLSRDYSIAPSTIPGELPLSCKNRTARCRNLDKLVKVAVILRTMDFSFGDLPTRSSSTRNFSLPVKNSFYSIYGFHLLLVSRTDYLSVYPFAAKADYSLHEATDLVRKRLSLKRLSLESHVGLQNCLSRRNKVTFSAARY